MVFVLEWMAVCVVVARQISSQGQLTVQWPSFIITASTRCVVDMCISGSPWNVLSTFDIVVIAVVVVLALCCIRQSIIAHLDYDKRLYFDGSPHPGSLVHCCLQCNLDNNSNDWWWSVCRSVTAALVGLTLFGCPSSSKIRQGWICGAPVVGNFCYGWQCWSLYSSGPSCSLWESYNSRNQRPLSSLCDWASRLESEFSEIESEHKHTQGIMFFAIVIRVNTIVACIELPLRIPSTNCNYDVKLCYYSYFFYEATTFE